MNTDDLYEQAVEFYRAMAVERPREWFLEAWHDHWTWKGRAVLLPLNLWGDFYMARGKGNAKPANGKAAHWSTTFVDIPLNGHEWTDIADTWPTPEEVFEVATSLLENGYRLGFSYNGQNDAFICSVTCKDDTSINAGKTFTAFAGSWYEALQAALFKHYVVSAERWGNTADGTVRPIFG